MAGDWIKIRSDLERKIELVHICSACGISHDRGVLIMYQMACWFNEFGKYGKMDIEPKIIDFKWECPGLAAAMMKEGWLFQRNGVLMLDKFCTVSALRKSLGNKIRQEVLEDSVCAACGSPDDLEVDHKIPVCRGGSCEIENLQALCSGCNRRKGRKTMQEFMANAGDTR